MNDDRSVVPGRRRSERPTRGLHCDAAISMRLRSNRRPKLSVAPSEIWKTSCANPDQSVGF